MEIFSHSPILVLTYTEHEEPETRYFFSQTGLDAFLMRVFGSKIKIKDGKVTIPMSDRHRAVVANLETLPLRQIIDMTLDPEKV